MGELPALSHFPSLVALVWLSAIPYQRPRRKNSHNTATIMTIHSRGWTTRPSTAAMTTMITAMRMSINTLPEYPRLGPPKPRTAESQEDHKGRPERRHGPVTGIAETTTIHAAVIACPSGVLLMSGTTPSMMPEIVYLTGGNELSLTDGDVDRT